MTYRAINRVLISCLALALAACGGGQTTASSSGTNKPVTVPLMMLDPTDSHVAKLLVHAPAGAVIAPYQNTDDTMAVGPALIRTHQATLRYELNWGTHYFTRLVAPQNGPVVTKCDPMNYGATCHVVVGAMSLANQGTENGMAAFDCTLTLNSLGQMLKLKAPNTISLFGWQHTGDEPGVFVVGKQYRCVLPNGTDGNPQFPA